METHSPHHSLRGAIPAHGLRRRPVWHKPTSGLAAGAAGGLWLASLASTHAADLTASDGATNNFFGVSVSQAGNIGLVGAYGATNGSNDEQGAAYVFRHLDTATGTVTQDVKLTASDASGNYNFGISASLSGTIGLVSASNVGNNDSGAAYVFRNLDTATGTVTQNVELTASDGAAFDQFGVSVSLSGSVGLVGAGGANIGSNSGQGAAYLYRNLDTATGSVTENVKLTASDGAAGDFFGQSVSLSGNVGLVGAWFASIGSNTQQGAAYVFRNLDTATGTVTQNVKLIASDGAAGDYFGISVSQSGSIALVGALFAKVGSNSAQGAAYVYRNLDTATGTVTQNVKLIASDGAANDFLGQSVSLSGSSGLVGAAGATIGSNNSQGAAYLFRNLDTATGTATEAVKLIASDGAAGDYFGSSVSLSGDQFTIGASNQNSYTGKAYTGTVSSVTTLDAGSTSRTIDGISFVSQTDWIIGQTTSGNAVTLLTGNSANVTASGKAVYVGQNAGSNNNTLTINGTLTANQVNVGAAGNTGNALVVNGTATAPIAVASGSTLGGHGTVGTITGAGLVAPGDPQILTATSVDPSGGMSFAFSLTQPGSPAYTNASASGNDVLHLIDPSTPLLSALTSANTITVDFSGATLQLGQTYLGGFFTDAALPDAMVNQATFDYTGTNGDTVQYEGLVTEPSAAYATGTVTNGEVMEFQVTAPEPGSAALLVLGVSALLGWRRRRASV